MSAALPLKTAFRGLIVAVVATLPPAFLPYLLLPPGTAVSVQIALYFGITTVWSLLLVLTGAFRWSALDVWRFGWHPCLCDQPVRCRRHHSSPSEPNRPGIVAARLAKTESEDA